MALYEEKWGLDARVSLSQFSQFFLSSQPFFLLTLPKVLCSYLFLSHSLHLWSARFGCCSLATSLCWTRGSCILPGVPICHMALKYTGGPAGSDQETPCTAAASGQWREDWGSWLPCLAGCPACFYGTDCGSGKHRSLLRAQTPPEVRGCCLQITGKLG